MKKATNRILSFLSAFAMVIGVLVAPFANANAAEADTDVKAGTSVAGTASEETTTTVTLHKIKVSSLDGLPFTKKNETETAIVGENGIEYTGNKIEDEDLARFFGEDRKAEELAGVKFVYWVFDDQGKYEEMVKNPTSYETVADVDDYLGKGVTKKEVTSAKGGVALDAITVPAGENKFVWAVETSKVIPGEGEDGEKQTITGMKAVPFGLALPLFGADGKVNTDLHVYPKNTTANQPKVDKDFKGNANAKKDRKEVDNNIVEDHHVGDNVPYEIETLIPAGVKYKTAVWTDQMTEGLTFNDDVKVSIGEKGEETALEAAGFKVTKDHNGFILELTETGLAKINEQHAETRIYVEYSATLNENAKVERQERNDVIFHYGNNPQHGNTPYPTKPNQETGKLTVEKNFPNVEGDWEPGESVEVTLVDAHTGKVVEFEDEQEAKVTLTETKKTHTWTGLDKDKQYKVVETFKAGDQVTYEYKDDGTVVIHDEKTDNPTPMNPQEPGVVTYGHRFQKIDQTDGTGIADAEFIVQRKNGEATEYLVKKGKEELEAEQADYAAAEKAYKDAVKAADSDKSDTDNIKNLKEKRDKAYVKAQSQWEFAADDTNATVFKSNKDGYFKVTGLATGDYELVETEAPNGYAKLTAPVPFKVEKGSTGETELSTGNDKNGFTQVENKKVTIPQTGGIGSLIFIVAGIVIMAIAFAMKRRNSYEEA